MANDQNLKPFQPGHDDRRNTEGRPKKIYNLLKQSGYSSDDMRDAFQEIGWQSIDDAEEILNDPTKPLILKILAKAFIRGAEKGDYRYVGEIVEHAMGKPTEKKDVKLSGEVNLNAQITVVTSAVPLANSEKDIKD